MKSCAGVWKIIVTKSRWGKKYLYLTKEEGEQQKNTLEWKTLQKEWSRG